MAGGDSSCRMLPGVDKLLTDLYGGDKSMWAEARARAGVVGVSAALRV